VLAANGAIAEQPHPHRRRGRNPGGVAQRPEDQARKELGVPGRAPVPEAEVHQAAGAHRPAEGDDPVAVVPGRRQQHGRVRRWRVREEELVAQPQLGVQPVGHRVPGHRAHQQLGLRARLARRPAGQLGQARVARPGAQRSVQGDDAASLLEHSRQLRRTFDVGDPVGGHQDHVVAFHAPAHVDLEIVQALEQRSRQ